MNAKKKIGLKYLLKYMHDHRSSDKGLEIKTSLYFYNKNN